MNRVVIILQPSYLSNGDDGQFRGAQLEMWEQPTTCVSRTNG
jgi:hypothetical protein